MFVEIIKPLVLFILYRFIEGLSSATPLDEAQLT